MRRPAVLAVAMAVAASLVAGCRGDDEPSPPPTATTERTETTVQRTAPRPPPLEPARCPAGSANCASATGRVLYVERVDPDGDGDAHFVLSGGNVTGPGLSVIDVAPALRPDPLPRAGDLVTASGPVYRGSYGQRQIEARQLRVRRR